MSVARAPERLSRRSVLAATEGTKSGTGFISSRHEPEYWDASPAGKCGPQSNRSRKIWAEKAAFAFAGRTGYAHNPLTNHAFVRDWPHFGLALGASESRGARTLPG